MEKKNGLVFTWTLYPQAEDLLRSKGYIFEKVTIPMDQFDLKWSRHNCARLDEAIIESYVEAIMQSMANGDSYPMPVAIQLKSGLFGLLDGNQRDEGARRLGATAIDCYLVKLKQGQSRDVAERLLPRMFNSLNGVKTKNDDLLRHAVFAINEFHLSVSQAANDFKISVNILYQHVRRLDVEEELLGAGLGTSEVRKMNDLDRLRTIPLKNVRIAAGKAAIKYQMKREEIVELVQKVKAEDDNESAMLAVILEIEKACEAEIIKDKDRPLTPTKQPMAQRSLFLQRLHNFIKIIKGKKKLQQLGIVKGDLMTKTRKELADVSDQCHCLATNK